MEDDGLPAALRAYEQALRSGDASAVVASFAPDEADGAGRTVRVDGDGMVLGAEAVAAFQRDRGPVAARTVVFQQIRRLSDAAAVVTTQLEQDAGGLVTQTQVWAKQQDGWKILAAHLTYPPRAVDPRIWRVAGTPLVPAAFPGDGPLSGRTVAVKDLFAVAGFRTGAGNPAFLAEQTPQPAHATAVARLLAAGASVTGIAQTDEFAYSLAGTNAHYGSPPNPHAPGRIPGGSSSGSTSAVALGQVDVGLGTDTGGSIRVPASYQGLWGIRTTHGAVDVTGLLPLAPSFDTVGVLTRDPGTLAAATRVLLDDPTRDAASSLVGLASAPTLDEIIEPDVATRVTAVRGVLEGDGLQEVVDLTPALLGRYLSIFQMVQGHEAWRRHGAWVTDHGSALGPDVLARFRRAAEITDAQAELARAELAEARARIRDAVGDHALLIPAASSVAPRASDASGGAIERARSATMMLTCIAGLGGLPAVALPTSRPGELPIGMCLVGPAGSDLHLIDLAARLSTTWTAR